MGDLIPSKAETTRSLTGVLMLLEKDPRGFDLLDTSVRGFFRSFLAFFWCWPALAFMWANLWRYVPEIRPDTAAGFIGYFARAGFVDLLAWVVPVLVLVPVARLFGFHRAFPRLIVATNWFGLVATYLVFFGDAFRYVVEPPQAVSDVISLAAYAITIGLYYRISRLSLGGDSRLAMLATLITVFSGLIVSAIGFEVQGF